MVSRDFIISFKKWLFQITFANRPFPQSEEKITVKVRLDASFDLYFRKINLSCREITKVTEKEVAA